MLRAVVASALVVSVGCASAPSRCSSPAAFEAVDGTAWHAIHPISTQNGFAGTAWHAGDGLFVTASHLLTNATELWVLGQPAEVVRVNPFDDLAVLRLPGHDGPSLELGRPEVGVRARARGYTFSPPRRVQTTGTVSSLEHAAGRVLYDGGIQPGMSGSPVLDDHGRVLGVVLGSKPWSAAIRSPNPTMNDLCGPEVVAAMLAGIRPDDPAIPLTIEEENHP